MMIFVLSVVALAAAQPSPECDLNGDLAILLDPAVDSETFQQLKQAAMEAALLFDLAESRMGIWQMTQPPKLELAMGLTNQEDLVRKFTEIVQVQPSNPKAAVETMEKAAQSLSSELDQQNKGILYVAGSPKEEGLLQTAAGIRYQGITIGAIAVGMSQEDAEDLFAMTGSDSGVLQLPSGATDTAGRVADFVCNKSKGIGAQDGCVFGLFCW